VVIMIRSSCIRFPVDPRDVPAEKAARRLHLTPADFAAKLPALLARGFPQPDPTTGMFDLTAIDEWMTARHSAAAVGLTSILKPSNAQEVFGDRRGRHGGQG
jgi:hypothetical protein